MSSRRAFLGGLAGALACGHSGHAEPVPAARPGKFRIVADYTFGNADPAATIRTLAELRRAFFFRYIYDHGRLDRLPYEWAKHAVYEPTDPRTLHVFTPNNLILKGRVPDGGGFWPGGLEAGMLRGKIPIRPGMVIELRARLPRGIGLLPAFWLIAGAEDDSGVTTATPWPPEIDIFEFLQFRGRPRPTSMEGHVQVNGDPARYGSPHDLFTEFRADRYEPGIDFSLDFHTFTLDWVRDQPIWLVDGRPIKQTYYQWNNLPAHVLVGNQIGLTLPGVDVSGMETGERNWDFVLRHLRIWQRST